MAETLTVAAVTGAPELITCQLAWRGEAILFRPLRSDDGPRLFAYFKGLSAQTRHLYHSHPFTPEYTQQLCGENDQDKTVRMLAVREQVPSESALAYLIPDFGLSEDDVHRYLGCDVHLRHPILRIGPSVSEVCRGQGLGTVLMEAVAETARRFGCSPIMPLGGVLAINYNAIRDYKRVAVRKMGTYGGGEGPPSWDIMLEL